MHPKSSHMLRVSCCFELLPKNLAGILITGALLLCGEEAASSEGGVSMATCKHNFENGS